MATPGTEKLRLKALNIEKGSARFSRGEGFDPYETVMGRNNLTALSQRRNLLFTAQNRKIYVWEPTGPWQTLGGTPALILTPMMKRPNGRGFFSEARIRHAINHLIVDELGQDEVVLIVTDSGNVCGYDVETFYTLIEQAKANGETLPLDEPRIEPFLCEFVGASAWGLAVHKEARLVAVGCHACTITVFAFALVDCHDRDSESDDALGSDFHDRPLAQDWVTIETSAKLRDFRDRGIIRRRSHNLRLIHRGHRNTIPSVSFFNCDLVPDGAWMVSVDIENRVIFWDIWKSLDPWTEMHLRKLAWRDSRFSSDDTGCSVIALDPRSFRLRRSVEQADDSDEYWKFDDYDDYPAIRDVTGPNSDIPDFINWIPPHQPRHQRDNPDEVLDDFFFPDIFGEGGSSDPAVTSVCPRGMKRSFDEGDSDDSKNEQRKHRQVEQMSAHDVPDIFAASHEIQSNGERRENATTGGAEQLGGFQDPEPAAVPGSQDVVDPIDNAGQTSVSIAGETGQLPTSEGNVRRPIPTFDELSDWWHEEDWESSDESINESIASVSSWEIEGYQYDELSGLEVNGRIFPVLQFTRENIRMILGPLAERPTVISGPPDHFYPYSADGMSPLAAYRQYNMVKYIPEDGLVVVATQMGHVGIISLAEAHLKGHMFRMRWMVPLRSQEIYGDRPLMPLLGMAVGPVQGQELPMDASDCSPQQSNNDMLFHFCMADEERGLAGEEKGAGFTSALSHGCDNRHCKPREQWQGWQSSRRYRLLLIYADHSVLSYEFWYEREKCDDMIL